MVDPATQLAEAAVATTTSVGAPATATHSLVDNAASTHHGCHAPAADAIATRPHTPLSTIDRDAP